MNFSATIQNAYQDRTQIGSCFTAPLKSYEQTVRPYLIEKIEDSQYCCSALAYKACLVVAEIFSYLVLGVISLVGIGLNLCCIGRAREEESRVDDLAPNQSGNGIFAEQNTNTPHDAPITNLALVLPRHREAGVVYSGRSLLSILFPSGSLSGKSIGDFTSSLREKIGEAKQRYDLMSRCGAQGFHSSETLIRDGTETYRNHYQLNFRFSLAEGATEEEKSEFESHTIELLGEDNTVVETYHRQLTTQNNESLSQRKLDNTIDYITDLLSEAHRYYGWVPQDADVSHDMEGNIVVKICVPDRLQQAFIGV